MNPMSLASVAKAVGGELFGAPDLAVAGVAADSGAVKPGDLFVAIPGDRVDGHDFAPAAMAVGIIQNGIRSPPRRYQQHPAPSTAGGIPVL
jgi:UDP-N-acetylmuramoyl-tripeptide--D-alanyl-D-alanine ligase